MKKQIKKYCRLVTVLLTLTITILLGSSVSANFAVQPVIPENQVDQNSTSFDLKLNPGQQQKLVVKVINSDNQVQKVKVAIDNTTTGFNGQLDDANTSKKKTDSSLEYPFATLFKYPKEIEVPANATIDFEAELTAPAKDFTGILLGAIHFSNGNKKDKSTSGASSETAYNVGILLRGATTKVTSDLKLKSVYAGLDNYRNAIFLDLQNPIAGIITKIKTKASIYNLDDYAAYKTKKGNKPNPIYSDAQQEKTIAPNSTWSYPVQLGSGESFKAGKYTAVLNVKSMQGEWNFERNFEITAEEAKKFNDKDVTIVKPDYMKWILIGLGILLIILIITLIVRRQIKKNKELKELRAKVHGDDGNG